MSIIGSLINLLHLKRWWKGTAVKCYSGVYAGGKATYHYYEVGGERVYHGRMNYSLTYTDEPYGKGLKTAKGTFSDGKKHGRWKFVNRNHDERSVLTVNYAEGVADGECLLRMDCRNSLAFHKGKTRLKLSMKSGVPVGVINGRFPHRVLTGGYDDSGRPDGQWTLRFTADRSSLVNYEECSHGVCIEAYEFDNSTGKRRTPKVRITEFLSNFISQNWQSLTMIMPKGSTDWSGLFVPADNH